MTDYAVRLFYLGEKYHGSQKQPHVRTVQGELIDALTVWSGTTHTAQSVRFSGRTDRGVHSLGQIAVISSEKPIDIDKINRELPEDIILWAVTEAPSEFQPRFGAFMRHYRYFLDDSWESIDVGILRRVIPFLIGSNNFALLSKPEPDRNTVTTVLNIVLSHIHDVRFIDFFGTSFLWKFVRKVITILHEIGLGSVDQSIVRELLEGNKRQIPGGIEPAPPENLFLMETVVPFKLVSSKYALRRIAVCLKDRIALHNRLVFSYSGALRQFTV